MSVCERKMSLLPKSFCHIQFILDIRWSEFRKTKTKKQNKKHGPKWKWRKCRRDYKWTHIYESNDAFALGESADILMRDFIEFKHQTNISTIELTSRICAPLTGTENSHSHTHINVSIDPHVERVYWFSLWMRLNTVISRTESCVECFLAAGPGWENERVKLRIDACRACNMVFMACDQGH